MKRGTLFLPPGLALLALVVIVVAFADRPSFAQCIRPTDCLPPPGGCAYPAPGTCFYPASPGPRGVRKMTLLDFSHCDPPPATGLTADSFFDVFIELELTTNGGVTWTPRFCGAHCIVRSHHLSPDPLPGTRLVDIEILQMSLTGGNLPVGTLIRESPTLASTGQTRLTDLGGQFQIDSFFDVFTELSIDNGQTWAPSSSPLRMTLGPVNPTPTHAPTWGELKTIYR